MTTPSRRQKIEVMLASDPQDQFLRYALAMECAKAGEDERCLELFGGLMSDASPHIPSFLMAGQHLQRIGRIDDAREVLRRGIDNARRVGNSHAAGEMSELLASLGGFDG